MRTYSSNRKEYNKRIQSQKHCEFCDVAVIKKQACTTLTGEYWYVLAAKYPYLDGNVMIIPKRHIEFLEKVSSEEWQDLHRTIVRTQGRLGELFKTKDFNIGINIGKESSASIKHLHWQLIPRKKKESRLSALNIFADLQLISISGNDLKRMIDSGNNED